MSSLGTSLEREPCYDFTGKTPAMTLLERAAATVQELTSTFLCLAACLILLDKDMYTNPLKLPLQCNTLQTVTKYFPTISINHGI